MLVRLSVLSDSPALSLGPMQGHSFLQFLKVVTNA